jgi:hypothetical protein
MVLEFYTLLSTPNVIDMATYAVGLSQAIGLNSNTFNNPLGSLIRGCFVGYCSMKFGRFISDRMPSQFKGLIPIVCTGAIIASQIKHYYGSVDDKHYLFQVSYENGITNKYHLRIPHLVSIDL